MIQYMTVPEASHRWSMEPQMIREQCMRGAIEGAKQIGSIWLVPAANYTLDICRTAL